MKDLQRLGAVAIVSLVVLRIAIGWQFFYEGIWKYERVGTAEEWSAAGYLKNSRGPFRKQFVNLNADPNDTNWLDYDWVNGRWEDWEERFVSEFNLDAEGNEDLRKRFDLLMNGPKEIVGRKAITIKPLDNRNPIHRNLKDIIRMRKASDGNWYLIVDGKKHLTPPDKARLIADAKKIEAAWQQDAEKARDPQNKKTAENQVKAAKQFQAAVEDVYKRNTRLSYRERLQALLIGDRERVSKIHEDLKGTVDYKRPSKTSEYLDRLVRYDAMLSGARTDFQQDQLTKEAARIAALRAELVGPVKQLEQQMQKAAHELLPESQWEGAAIVAVDNESTWIDRINQITMWSLMIIGFLLMIGFLSRTTALAGGLLVLSFYLAMPPWPGVPPAPGPEHSLFVNKNLIEVLALFALAAIPTGKYFGVDAGFIGCCGFGANRAKGSAPKTKRSTKEPATSKPEAEKAPAADEKPKSPEPVTATADSGSPDAKPADTYTVRAQDKK